MTVLPAFQLGNCFLPLAPFVLECPAKKVHLENLPQREKKTGRVSVSTSTSDLLHKERKKNSSSPGPAPSLSTLTCP